VLVIRGVYAFGRDIETRESAWRAALLAAGPGSALTGRSACELWGIVQTRRKLPGWIVVAVTRGERRSLRGRSPALRQTTISVVRRQLEPGDLRTKDGLPLVRPGFALIDLAAFGTEREVLFAFLEACRLKLFDERELGYCYRRLLGRRGAEKLRPLLALWTPELKRIKSVFEGRVLLDLKRRNLPIPLVNVKIHGKEVDEYWPGSRLVVELDGGAFHSDPVQKAVDRAKQRHLEAQGLTVLRVSYKTYDADPDAFLDWVASHLEQQSEPREPMRRG